MNHTSATLAGITTNMRSRKFHMLANELDQQRIISDISGD